MRDDLCTEEIRMLSEHRISPANGTTTSVFTRVEVPTSRASTAVKDRGDAENGGGFDDAVAAAAHEHHYQTIKVLIPSRNKWNCFSIYDNRQRAPSAKTPGISPHRAVVSQVHIVSPPANSTTSLAVTNFHNTKKPSQTIMSSSGREPRERTSRVNRSRDDTSRVDTSRVDTSREDTMASSPTRDPRPFAETAAGRRSQFSKFKTKSFEQKSEEHEPNPRGGRPATSGLTEEKTIFGFKVMKGTNFSGNIGTSDKKLNSGTSSRMREPRQSGTNGKGGEKSETSNLFYMPKTAADKHERGEKSRKGSKEEQVDVTEKKVDEERKEKKGLTRAESLQEGKARLGEFREKQRRERLSRASTVLVKKDGGREGLSSSSKDISESLAEIRERIRERRRKKDDMKRSQSLPEVDREENDKGTRSATTSPLSRRRKEEPSRQVETTSHVVRREKKVRGGEDVSHRRASLAVPESDEDLSWEEENGPNKTEDPARKDAREEHVESTERKIEHVSEKVVSEKDTAKQASGVEKSSVELSGVERKSKDGFRTSGVGRISGNMWQPKKEAASLSDGEGEGVEEKKRKQKERRKAERYRRSQTMSAIVQSDICTTAAREAEHKSVTQSTEATLDMPSVLDIKKRFSESDSGKLSEPGLNFENVVVKDATSTKDVTNNNNVANDEDASITHGGDTAKTNDLEYVGFHQKDERRRRHTHHGISEAAKVKDIVSKPKQNGSVTFLIEPKDERSQSNSGILRRHTFQDKTTQQRSPLRSATSVERLRERFSGGGTSSLPETGSAKSAFKRASSLREDPRFEKDKGEQNRRRVKSDSAAQEQSDVKGNEGLESRKDGESDGKEEMKPVAKEKSGKREKEAKSDSKEQMESKREEGLVKEVKSDTRESTESPGKEERKQDSTVIKKETKAVAEAYIALTPPSKRDMLGRRHTVDATPSSSQREHVELKKHEKRAVLHDKYLKAKEDQTQKKEVFRTKSEQSSGLSKSTEHAPSDSKTKDVSKLSGHGSSDSKSKDVSKSSGHATSDSKTKEVSKTTKDASKTNDGKKTTLKKEEEKPAKKKRGESASVSKLRQLFLGKSSTAAEKKTKLKERRAKTIAGGITPEVYKDIDDGSTKKSKSQDVDLVEPVFLPEEKMSKEAESKAGSSLESKARNDSEKPSLLSTSKRTDNLPDITLTAVTKEERLPDVLKDRPLSDSSHATSESDVTQDGGAKQSLDEFLTSIQGLTGGSPKTQRKLMRSQKLPSTISRDEEDIERHRNLNVEKSNLSHAWSTSDLDKIFYGAGKSPQIPHVVSELELSAIDFDEISSSTTRLPSLTESRTKLTRPKRNASKSSNPLKSLQERTDIRTTTEEPEEEKEKPAPGFEKAKKRSVPRKKRSQIEPWRRHTLDPVALAALASREDFSRVSLRKTKGPGKEKGEFDGSLPVMLLQIKGRRQVQTRLVEPKMSSLNSGDCFILVTPKELFCWIGKKANTIEKAKAVEISSKIQKRADMNCKTGDVLYIEEEKQGNCLAYKKFCKILEGDTSNPIQGAQLCPDDEFYEREIISTNRIYKLQEADPPHLVPVRELTGHLPRFNVLNTKEVFVFDFGSEVYVWTGQHSLSAKRKVAFHLAMMVYKQSFKTKAVVSPIAPNKISKRGPQGPDPVYHDAEGKECARPPWTLFARLHEKSETLLFQEKFFDWPDPTKIIKMKGHISSGEILERAPREELKPCDVTEMQKPAPVLEQVKLEGTNLGRGLGTPNVETSGVLHEGDLVTTLDRKVWLVTAQNHYELPKESEGHFHSGDGYVIRWVYFVAKNRIVKDKRGRMRPLTGRQRCAYFFWQGNDCSVSEKGAAAIMAVELDEERGPQIRVIDSKEPPHFLKLFDGAMIIHAGKRDRSIDGKDDFTDPFDIFLDKSTVRMYCVRSEDTSEGCLIQVRKSASSLRSRSSFVLVDSELGKIFIWHGCKANEYHRKVAEKAANLIKERKPIEVNLSANTSLALTEIEEGQEPEPFWKTLGGRRTAYISLIKDPLNHDVAPRLYNLTSAMGQFLATEILCPSRYPSRTCPFPVFQADIYCASQPAVFLLDVGDELYVWEGWLPGAVTKDLKGSTKRRYDEERKLALETALAYVKQANNRIKKGVFVVQAGLEPLSFTNHFPFWDKKQRIADIKIKEGKQDCEKKPAKEVLETFSKKYYTLRELTSDNPPDGVDLSKLEKYLSDDEFEKIFEMRRDLYEQLPGWKQDILKKAFALF